MQSFLTFKNESRITVEIKRSKFIACSYTVENEETILKKLSEARKKHPDADHYCYAYILSEGGMKCSDDKEPAKTAGYPILEALKSKNLSNALIVVIRYFGGVKLGTGGLARAYKSAATAVIETSGTLNYIFSAEYNIITDYTFAEVCENTAQTFGKVIGKNYDNGAEINAVCPENDFKALTLKINEVTGAKAQIIPKGKIFFPYEK
jgi:uncharacterized YigZ family protein